MTAKNKEIKFALTFPQGNVLFMKEEASYGRGDIGGIYFQPQGSADAFMVWGERKELFGKNAVTVSLDRNAGTEGYSVVYEFDGKGAAVDARLVSKTETVGGALADAATLLGLNEALAQDKIKLHGRQDTALTTVFNVASFPDGRLLVQLFNKNELYLGRPGNYTKLDAQLMAQGGNSMYYKLATGESVELPYSYGGPGPNHVPTFNGQELVYLNVQSGADPAKFGLTIEDPATTKPLNPFSPELKAARPAAPPKP